jgi:hypothetical protein
MEVWARKLAHACTHSHACRLEFIIQTCTGDMCSERVEAFGGNGGSPFFCPVPQGQELVGLAGALGGHLHSISVYTVQPEVRAPALVLALSRLALSGR